MKYLINIYEYLNEAKIEDIYSKYYSDIDANTFNKIISADPTTFIKNNEVTKMGLYSKWLLNLYKNNKLLLEDLYKATEYLSEFHRFKTSNIVSGQVADINKYKTLPELLKFNKSIGGTGSVDKEDESYLLTDRYFINNGEAELFYEDEHMLIVIPNTLKASQFYAYNTEWCTQYPENFKKYTQDGKLYIMIDKALINKSSWGKRVQFHFESGSAMNTIDEKIPYDAIEFWIEFFRHRVPYSFTIGYENVHKDDDVFVVEDEDYNCYLLDLEGCEITDKRYYQIGLFGKDTGLAMVAVYDDNDNEIYGYINKKGEEIIPLICELLGEFHHGLVPAKIQGKFQVINTKGEVVLYTDYNYLDNFVEGRAIAANSFDGKYRYGYIDITGKVIIPFEHQEIYDIEKGSIWAKKNGYWGAYDIDGNIIEDFIHHKANR
jgi:hypothetical protein